MVREEVVQRFRARYGEAPAFVVRAPGRVNLIGEHTDYNEGFVLPIAIDRAVWIALRPRSDLQVEVYAGDYEASIAFDLTRLEHAEEGWGEYVKGMAWALQQEGHSLSGWEGVLGGDVPRGAGLSSSAAVELSVAWAFVAVSGFTLETIWVARLGQRVEHEWIGVQCGIMDQLVVAGARKGAALLIDCRTLAMQALPLPEGTTVAVLDTGTRRGLVDSAYNERRSQCESAARALGVPALRDVDPGTLEARREVLDDVIHRRARHVVTENARTLEAAEALHAGDTLRFGALMNASHRSLRDDFEVSSPALDTIVEVAWAHPACYGARLTGAGFGGCAVALVDAERATPFVQTVAEGYRARTRLDATAYLCQSGAGASLTTSLITG